jgi:ATP-dependent Lhr-like helicase
VPASALESLVQPARVVDYSPALLDEAMSQGIVLWQGHGALAGNDGWISLHLTDGAELTLHHPLDLPELDAERRARVDAVSDVLESGGAYFFRSVVEQVRELPGSSDVAVAEALWELVWSGHVAGDTYAPVRALLAQGRTAHKRTTTGPAVTRYGARRSRLGALGGASRGLAPRMTAPPTVVGRWSRLPEADDDPTRRAYAVAELLLDRYGIVTRGSVVAEEVPGGFAAVYRVLAAAEESGRVRRGYFVDGLGASQFGGSGAVDRLRSGSRVAGGGTAGDREPPATIVLAATDPANPYGAALPWPDRAREGDEERSSKHQPGRKAGALVVLIDGALVLYVERGGRTLLTWTDDAASLQSAADALALAVREGALGRLTVEKADGTPVLGSSDPLAAALLAAGFHATPRGLRLRR